MEDHYKTIHADEDSSMSIIKPKATVVCFKELPLSICLVLWTILSIASSLAQQISMPIAIWTFGNTAGAYAILLICSTFFNVIFWIWTYIRYTKNQISKETFDNLKFGTKIFWMIIAVGVCDALNGILTVFSSSPKRVPPVLQPILLQSYIFFTLIISKFWLKKHYKLKQYLNAFLVIVGIVVSLIPLFIQIANGGDTEFQSGYLWGVMMFFSPLPAVMMSVLQEELYDKIRGFDIILFLALESLIQMLFIMFCFWIDLIPGFGTASSFSELVTNLTDNISCIFFSLHTPGTHCNYCAALILFFSLAYCGSYVYTAELIKYASANFCAMVSSTVAPLATSWWIIFPAMNAWIDGPPTDSRDLIWYVFSMLIIIPASFFFKRDEMEDKARRLGQIHKKQAVDSGSTQDSTMDPGLDGL